MFPDMTRTVKQSQAPSTGRHDRTPHLSCGNYLLLGVLFKLYPTNKISFTDVFVKEVFSKSHEKQF